MMKDTSKTKSDYNKMNEGELKHLLHKHQQMLNNTRLINALPDKGQRLRNSINEIEKCLALPVSPMDCDLINQFDQMSMSSNEKENSYRTVYLTKSDGNILKEKFDQKKYSDEHLNEVKQRLKARQAEREKQTTITTAKLISLDEAIQLYNEERKQTEEHLIQQTTARLLGNMSLSKTTFGLPSNISSSNNYRKTPIENAIDIDDEIDEFGRDKVEIVSDHDSEEIDYPDEQLNDDN